MTADPAGIIAVVAGATIVAYSAAQADEVKAWAETTEHPKLVKAAAALAVVVAGGLVLGGLGRILA